MKAHIDIECTPEEARAFLGLPDVRAMQEALTQEMRERLLAAMRASDPETLMKTWMPAGVAGIEQWQKIFWQAFNKRPDAG